MKKLIVLTIMLTALLLSGCGSASEATFAPVSATTDAASATTKSSSNDEQDLADLTIDPPYDFDISTMYASDFGAFKNSYNSTVSTYEIGDGTSTWSHTVTVIKGEEDGPSVYVIAGIHGDEEAAWQAGNLLKKATIKAGTLYIVSPANNPGSAALSRYIQGKDPNRVWPGSADGNAAEKNAYYIFQDVKDKDPDFVLDLHEARVVQGDGESLGNSIIYTNLDVWPDGLFFNFTEDSAAGKVTSRTFHTDAPGPDGSINNTITTELSIPTMTVETFRGYQMENRLSDQLAIVQYVLQFYGMVD